jgi:hypothetical protein
LIDAPLIVTLVVCAALPHLVRWLISHFGIPAAEVNKHDATGHES